MTRPTKKTKKIVASSMLAMLATGAIANVAWGNGGGSDDWEEEPSPPPTFALTTQPLGGVKSAPAAPAYIASSRITAVGEGALVSDADSGQLILTDAAGKSVAQLAIGRDAALLAFDDVARRAYVADRKGDRIVVVDVGDATLAITATWKTPAEPYGVALAPNRATVYVSTIADRTLVALDAATGLEKWRAALSPEPRGLAVSPDGARVVVASLSSGGVDELVLGERSRVRRVALPAFKSQHARGAFTVAFVGEHAVVPFHLARPKAEQVETSDHYGGSFTPPVTQHVAFLGANGRTALGQTNVVEPRAIAWSGTRDVMYLAGMATDHLVVVTKASRHDVMNTGGTTQPLAPHCGADGIAVTPKGNVLVWCSFQRSIDRFDPTAKKKKMERGTELVASSTSEEVRAGRALFHQASFHSSTRGTMSCGTCHLDGRADGLSWQIQKDALQTPVLGGRLVDTAPYKWDGKAADLETSVRATIRRLGGDGLSKRDVTLVVSFLESMPAPRTPTRDPAAIARGKTLFESAELGCATCHDGPALTDRETHELAGHFDTPGLGSLAASAPYFHDGSAPTLAAVLGDRGRVHGMSEGAKRLVGRDLTDLIAFLETR
jgi:sugar lactone lactonase YvrE